MSYDASGAPTTPGAVAIYRLDATRGWVPLGGTTISGTERIQLSVPGPGRYGVFTQPEPLTAAPGVSLVAFSPRVFSPTGGFGGRQLSINFTLGQSAPVGVNVYNLAGRLVRRLLDGQPMAGGANVVTWDGRDASGSVVNDGMYIVSVEALGNTVNRTVAVAR